MMIPLLVLSTGGFNIFTHWCHETGEKLISFQSPESCNHEKGEHHELCEAACCSHIENSHSCCENDHVYIKTVDNISSDDDRPALNFIAIFRTHLTDLVRTEQVSVVAEEFEFCDYTSPPQRSSKYLVVKYGNLKLDCCRI